MSLGIACADVIVAVAVVVGRDDEPVVENYVYKHDASMSKDLTSSCFERTVMTARERGANHIPLMSMAGKAKRKLVVQKLAAFPLLGIRSQSYASICLIRTHSSSTIRFMFKSKASAYALLYFSNHRSVHL